MGGFKQFTTLFLWQRYSSHAGERLSPLLPDFLRRLSCLRIWRLIDLVIQGSEILEVDIFGGHAYQLLQSIRSWRMSSYPLGDYMGTASEKFWSTFWDILTKFVEINLIILVCLVGRAGVLLCLDQVLNKTISWSLIPGMTRTSETKEGT